MSYCGNIVTYKQLCQIVHNKLETNVASHPFVSKQTSIPIGNPLENHIKLFAWKLFIYRSKNRPAKSFTRFLRGLPTGIVINNRSVRNSLTRQCTNGLKARYNSILAWRIYNHMELHVLGADDTH